MPHHAKPAGYLVEVNRVAPRVDLVDQHLPLFVVPDAPLKALWGLARRRLDAMRVSEKASHSSVGDRLGIRVCTIPSTKPSSPSEGTSSPR